MEVVIKVNSYNNSIIVTLPDFTDEKLKLKDIRLHSSSLDWEDLLEKEMTIHSRIFAQRIP